MKRCSVDKTTAKRKPQTANCKPQTANREPRTANPRARTANRRAVFPAKAGIHSTFEVMCY
ncbi:hypothetical protein F1609_33035 [Massilia sp. CCM 8693]|uniref:Uncharacterized protein n=1 Tax=Massilia aquatica TaxID=2609000 RepID=A0ABX0MCM6_9BURK|nr:hypothetical protein [Massilia aquatica]